MDTSSCLSSWPVSTSGTARSLLAARAARWACSNSLTRLSHADRERGLSVELGALLGEPLAGGAVHLRGGVLEDHDPHALGDQRDDRADETDGEVSLKPAVHADGRHGEDQRGVAEVLGTLGLVTVVASEPLGGLAT
ncbi:hypothetical protein ABZ752_15280 [Streptomyces roseifaciens]